MYEKKSLTEYKSIRSRCPFFKNNMCTSPVLNFPSLIFVNRDRCETVLHKTCRLYVLGVEKSERGNEGV